MVVIFSINIWNDILVGYHWRAGHISDDITVDYLNKHKLS